MWNENTTIKWVRKVLPSRSVQFFWNEWSSFYLSPSLNVKKNQEFFKTIFRKLYPRSLFVLQHVNKTFQKSCVCCRLLSKLYIDESYVGFFETDQTRRASDGREARATGYECEGTLETTTAGSVVNDTCLFPFKTPVVFRDKVQTATCFPGGDTSLAAREAAWST